MDGKNSLIFQPVLQFLRLSIHYFLREDQFTNIVWLQKKKKFWRRASSLKISYDSCLVTHHFSSGMALNLKLVYVFFRASNKPDPNEYN